MRTQGCRLSLAARAAALLISGGFCLSSGSAFAQFRAVNEVTGNSDGAVASTATSTAVGTGAFATSAGATAVGRLSAALGVNSTALGEGAFSSAVDSTALGQVAFAGGIGSTAIGRFSSAGDEFAIAIGNTASANFINSVAIGAGATTVRENQFLLGTATHSYTAPGITSAASTAAQVGPRQIVTTDADGNLAADTLAGLGLSTMADFANLQNDVTRNTEGVAMAMALTRVPTVLPEDMDYGVSLGYGNFDGENAMAFGGTARVSEAIFLNGGAAWGTDSSNAGGAAGVTFGW